MMTIEEVLTSGYGSTQFMPIKHFDSWFSNNNKDKNRMCSWGSHTLLEDIVGHSRLGVTDSAKENIKERT